MARERSDPKVLEAASAYMKEALRGTTQTEFAERVGLSQSTVSALLNKEKASRDTIEKLASAMGTTAAEILDGTAAEALRQGRLVPAPTRTYEPEPGQARTTDAEFWFDFARANQTFEEVATATLYRATEEKWPQAKAVAVLNIAARHVGRNYGGGPVTHAAARAAVQRGIDIIEGRDPDDEPQLPPKVPERAAPTPAPPAPKLTMKEKAAALAAKKGGRRG